MTTPLFLLRAVELGLFVSDLFLLTIGLVNDMFTEKNYDEYKYKDKKTSINFKSLRMILTNYNYCFTIIIKDNYRFTIIRWEDHNEEKIFNNGYFSCFFYSFNFL